ncbi:HNH endonuclease signature motif containing protein [Pseudomonas kilonensis]|uniref:HNH endonuclease signature motif containing protein n=1 Tax=Pseudomonas kilonensis TaxID=132476 RepID=UPI0020A1E52F|nr:HNH endonuclease signature motif containing protein [Pseudomonas kilonensis]MCP1455247.1 hypothetical protein [Pseudomonas kilonensis]
MAITETTSKLLWGRAAGMCSNPTCKTDLTFILENGAGFNVGEMAHVIASKPSGPRGVEAGGSDSYENLLLLCPTCHRMIDKAPAGEYSIERLHEWKSAHEQTIRSNGSALKFQTSSDLKTYICRLLLENKMIWSSFGPDSELAQGDPGSNSYEIWNLRKLNTIVPNNRKIINTIESNITLLNTNETEIFFLFKMHAEAFELHQYNRMDNYPLFPISFERAMRT